jgi:Holliday junction DNA helicase RuvA
VLAGPLPPEALQLEGRIPATNRDGAFHEARKFHAQSLRGKVGTSVPGRTLRGMIARLRGKPAANTPEGLVLDVGGVGYLVHATPTAVRKRDSADEITVETYLHVREDALQLYGFADRGERELFIQLLAVSGVGPKVALAIVSGSPAAELRRAILREDSARFQAIPGIGKKTADRIVLELKEKLAGSEAIAHGGGPDAPYLVARDALVELGWTLLDAERALAEVDADLSPEERVRLALKKAA